MRTPLPGGVRLAVAAALFAASALGLTAAPAAAAEHRPGPADVPRRYLALGDSLAAATRPPRTAAGWSAAATPRTSPACWASGPPPATARSTSPTSAARARPPAPWRTAVAPGRTPGRTPNSPPPSASCASTARTGCW
ncbi:hypothetical protein ACFQ1I_38235 [Kitasatospora arboriphila]